MLVLIMATIINTVPSSFESGPCLNLSLRNLCHLLADSMLQVPKPMDVPFNPSTSCQGAHHVFVVFLLHHLVGGWALLSWGHGCLMGPLSANTQPPPSPADSAWFLTRTRVLPDTTTTTDETGLPPDPHSKRGGSQNRAFHPGTTEA